MQDRSARALWEVALGQLQLQVTRPNFETWLRDTVGLTLDDGIFTLCVPSDFVAEWLNTRLNSLITKALAGIIGRPVRLAFQVDSCSADDTAVGATASTLDAVYPSTPVARARPRLRLNPLFTFDTFLVADCNRLAHAAAFSSARANGRPEHNPLFLYGESGLGKTHLMHAVAHELAAADLAVLYVNAETFLSDFVLAARQRQMDAFHNKYRTLDALLIDDVQFLAGKERTQEEFFHTFNHLHEAGKQLILASDQPPHTLGRFSARLRSRFQCGLIADLTAFSLDGRLALLRKKAAHLRAETDDSALEFLARQPYINVRELEGALNRVAAYARLTGQPADVALVRSAITIVEPPVAPAAPTPDAIVDTVCSFYAVTPQALSSQSRGKRVTTARHVAMYLLRQETCQPLTEIGRLFGDRDHSTVLYACRKIEREVHALPDTLAEVDAIRKRLLSAS